MSLAAALERAASALAADADAIRPANGDPSRLLASLAPEAATRVAEWLLANEPEDAAELVAAWADEERGAAVLLRIDETRIAKAGRKALRRALHRLRGRGVATPEKPKPPVVASLPKIDDELEAAFLSPLDPTGARMAYLVESAPGGGARIFELVLDEDRGIADCAVYTTGRSEARRFARALQERSRFPGVPVEAASVRALVARLVASRPAGWNPPRAFVEWRTRLATAAPGARTPGERIREALGAASDETALRRAVELVETRVVGPWPTNEDALRVAAEQLRDAAAGKIIVSGAQKAERLDAVLRERLGEVYDAAASERTAARFEETAFVLQRIAGGEAGDADARACLAAARAFRERPAAENPVARALLEALLQPILRTLREEEESSLIVKP